MGGGLGTHDIVGEALQRAAVDPGLTPELHSLLAEHPLLVPVTRLRPDPNGPEVSVIVLWKDPSDGQAFVPLFSNSARVPQGAPSTIRFVWDHLKRLTDVLPQAHFRLNPAGPVMFDLPCDLARTLVVGDMPAAANAPAMLPEGTDLGLGVPSEDHSVLIAALRSHFRRQPTAPTIYLYELYRHEGETLTRSLAIGVVTGFDPAIASAISAIVPEAYRGTLPVDVGFLGGNPEIVEALAAVPIEPILLGRATATRQ